MATFAITGCRTPCGRSSDATNDCNVVLHRPFNPGASTGAFGHNRTFADGVQFLRGGVA